MGSTAPSSLHMLSLHLIITSMNLASTPSRLLLLRRLPRFQVRLLSFPISSMTLVARTEQEIDRQGEMNGHSQIIVGRRRRRRTVYSPTSP